MSLLHTLITYLLSVLLNFSCILNAISDRLRRLRVVESEAGLQQPKNVGRRTFLLYIRKLEKYSDII